MSKTHYVYHLKLDGMGLDQGYIGISVNPISRFGRHKRRKDNPHLANAFAKYGDSIKMILLSAHETEHEARWVEYCLRPTKDIGWNVAQGGTKAPMLALGGHSEVTKKKMSLSHKGKVHSPEALEKMSASQKGRKLSQDQVDFMRERFAGFGSAKAKPANIYKYETDELVAEFVVACQWAKQNNLNPANLSKTAKADRNKPSTKNNVCHYKGFYVRYL